MRVRFPLGPPKVIMTVQLGRRYELFLRIKEVWLTGIDFVDRENRFYMAGEKEICHFRSADQKGDCVLVKATIDGGTDGGARVCLKDIEVIKNYGPKIGDRS
jgi:hypothetical protein